MGIPSLLRALACSFLAATSAVAADEQPLPTGWTKPLAFSCSENPTSLDIPPTVRVERLDATRLGLTLDDLIDVCGIKTADYTFGFVNDELVVDVLAVGRGEYCHCSYTFADDGIVLDDPSLTDQTSIRIRYFRDYRPIAWVPPMYQFRRAWEVGTIAHLVGHSGF